MNLDSFNEAIHLCKSASDIAEHWIQFFVGQVQLGFHFIYELKLPSPNATGLNKQCIFEFGARAFTIGIQNVFIE